MIFSFYSYKGGVGRTLILAHVGIYLAATRREKGYRVLLVDMDLDAPGLDVYFPVPGEPPLGFFGLLQGYQDHNRASAWLAENLESPDFIVPIEGTKNLFVLLSGIKRAQVVKDPKRPSYLETLGTLQREIPPTSRPELPTEGFFFDLGQLLRERFDYVLIDSRTGLPEVAYASTILLADALVLCFRLNKMNLTGIQTVLGNFLIRERKRVGDPDIRVVPVATPVPPRGGRDIEQWINLASRNFVSYSDDQEKQNDDGQVKGKDLFPVVSRVFFEPSFEIGERLAFKFSGEIEEGYSQETPIVGCFQDLGDRLLALNCDRDVIASEQIEFHYYDEKEQPLQALEYLFKRLRREPTELQHWEDFSRDYAELATIWPKAKERLEGLIAEWKAGEPIEDIVRDPERARKIAPALHYRVECFGKDDLDAGLSLAEEALECGRGTDLEENTEFLIGQIIDELVKVRKSAKYYRDRHGRDLSLKLANEHYSRSIELGRKAGTGGGKALLYRARNLQDLGNRDEAVADYDALFLERTPQKDEPIQAHHVLLLYEQAQTLEYLGYYGAAFRNYRAALAYEPKDEDVMREILSLAHHLGLFDFALEVSRHWERVRPKNPVLHRQKAIGAMLQEKFEMAFEESRLAHLYLAEPRMKILDGFIYAVQGNFQTACEVLSQVLEHEGSEYDRALYACCLALAGKEGAEEYIDRVGVASIEMRVMASLAVCRADLAQEILSRAENQPINKRDRAIFSLCKLALAAMHGDSETAEQTWLSEQFENLHLLPVCIRNTSEVVLFRRVLDHLAARGRVSEEGYTAMKPIWDMIDRAPAPRLEDLPPRNLEERVLLDS